MCYIMHVSRRFIYLILSNGFYARKREEGQLYSYYHNYGMVTII